MRCCLSLTSRNYSLLIPAFLSGSLEISDLSDDMGCRLGGQLVQCFVASPFDWFSYSMMSAKADISMDDIFRDA
jgi:hypothetical protein